MREINITLILVCWMLSLVKAQTKPEIKVMQGHSPSSMAIVPGGKFLLTGSDKLLKLWDISSGKELKTYTGHTGSVTAIDVSPDGKTFASASADSTAIIWDIFNGKILYRLKGHKGVVTCLSYSPGGDKLLTGSKDKVVITWNAKTGSYFTSKFYGDWIYCIKYLPDGNSFVCGDFNYNLHHSSKGSIKFKRSVGVLDVLHDGKFMVAAASDTICLVDIDNWKVLRKTFGHRIGTNEIKYSPDGKIFASGGG